MMGWSAWGHDHYSDSPDQAPPFLTIDTRTDGPVASRGAGVSLNANALYEETNLRMPNFRTQTTAGCVIGWHRDTHGHFDHVGAREKLAEKWDVPIYAHELEVPYRG
jgi:hypothetical protein